MGKIEVLSPGLYSTIQDSGRVGNRAFGVPLSGVMDQFSYALGNMLLGNDKNAPALEITLTGPKLLFHNQSVITVTGADMSPKINGKSIKTNAMVVVYKGDILSFGKLRTGCRSYLCIKKGFEVLKELGSSSTYEPAGLGFPVLKKGIEIPIHEYTQRPAPSNARIGASVPMFEGSQVEVMPGPEFDMMGASFIDQEYEAGVDSNRMGYQLNCKKPLEHTNSILTSVVMPGTIQLPSSGKPIVLMRDGQTTGGYPRILQVTDHGLNILAQKKPGDMLKLKLI